LLRFEDAAKLLLRCLLRDSGQDMRDKLDRPVGTRWISYAVPRVVFQLPTPKPMYRPPRAETVNVVRYALNTATVHRPVLPLLTDALLVGEKFRAALMALHGTPSENFGGKDADGNPLAGHRHAFFLPEDDDEDGFIDHVTVWCPRGFTSQEVAALTSFNGTAHRCDAWHSSSTAGQRKLATADPIMVKSEARGRSLSPSRFAGQSRSATAATSASDSLDQCRESWW
jgi:hypothetical protein